MDWNYMNGDLVRVVHIPGKYARKKGLSVGLIGKVYRYYRPTTVAVRFDDLFNASSGHGVFYFGPNDLVPELEADDLVLEQGKNFVFELDGEPIAEYVRKDAESMAHIIDYLNTTKEETPMNTMYTEKNCRVAGVTLDPYHDKQYAYALFLPDVELGAIVVARNSTGSLVLGKLTSINELPHERVKDGCEVICVVDLTDFNKRQEMFTKAANLRKKMDARIKALQDLALYEMLAKDDPELQAMLTDYKAISI